MGGITLLSSQFVTQPGADAHDCIGGSLAPASSWACPGEALPVGGWVGGMGWSGLGMLSALSPSLTKAPAQQLLLQVPTLPGSSSRFSLKHGVGKAPGVANFSASLLGSLTPTHTSECGPLIQVSVPWSPTITLPEQSVPGLT